MLNKKNTIHFSRQTDYTRAVRRARKRLNRIQMSTAFDRTSNTSKPPTYCRRFGRGQCNAAFKIHKAKSFVESSPKKDFYCGKIKKIKKCKHKKYRTHRRLPAATATTHKERLDITVSSICNRVTRFIILSVAREFYSINCADRIT